MDWTFKDVKLLIVACDGAGWLRVLAPRIYNYCEFCVQKNLLADFLLMFTAHNVDSDWTDPESESSTSPPEHFPILFGDGRRAGRYAGENRPGTESPLPSILIVATASQRELVRTYRDFLTIWDTRVSLFLCLSLCISLSMSLSVYVTRLSRSVYLLYIYIYITIYLWFSWSNFVCPSVSLFNLDAEPPSFR